MTARNEARPGGAAPRIAWYCRDGHLDIFPRVSRRARELGGAHEALYICHHGVDAQRLRSAHGIADPLVLGAWLAARDGELDISDARLREFERRFPAKPLVRCAWAELHMAGFAEEEVRRHLVAHFEFWERFLTENRVDVLVIELPSILSTCVAWCVCQTLGVEFLAYIDIAPLGDRMVFTTAWEGYYEGFEERLASDAPFAPEVRAQAKEYLERLESRPQRTAESAQRLATQVYHRFPWEKLRRLPGLLERERRKREYYIHSSGVAWSTKWLRSHVNLRLHTALHTFESGLPRHGERYFLLPLHMLGEWSNYTWMGWDYADVEAFVRRVAAALPLGCRLYVKEHFSGFGERSVAAYRRLSRVPGVRLVDPFADTFALVKGAEGVVTLGSSMGLEAWFLDKPVVLLAEPWYRSAPGLQRARSAGELARLLQDAADLPRAGREEKLRFLSALYAVSFRGWKFPHERTFSAENVEAWARALMRRVGLEQRTAQPESTLASSRVPG